MPEILQPEAAWLKGFFLAQEQLDKIDDGEVTERKGGSFKLAQLLRIQPVEAQDEADKDSEQNKDALKLPVGKKPLSLRMEFL